MFTEEWYEAGLLLNEPEPHLPNNYSSDVGQLNPKMRTIRRNPNQKCLCQQTRDKELDQWFLNVSDESDKNASLLKKSYSPHLPMPKQNKLVEVRRGCNPASKDKKICLNDILLAGLDLLQC